MFADELAKLELKFKEQLKTNENLKLQLAEAEDRYKVVTARAQELCMTRADAGALVCSKQLGQSGFLLLWLVQLKY